MHDGLELQRPTTVSREKRLFLYNYDLFQLHETDGTKKNFENGFLSKCFVTEILFKLLIIEYEDYLK